MATANRKQQREIEIAEKKVLDGVKEFKELWRKVEEAQVCTCALKCPASGLEPSSLGFSWQVDNTPGSKYS